MLYGPPRTDPPAGVLLIVDQSSAASTCASLGFMLRSALVFIHLANVSPAILWTVTQSLEARLLCAGSLPFPVTYSVVPPASARYLHSLSRS